MEALGEKYEEDVDNAKNSKEACGEDEKCSSCGRTMRL